MKKQTVLTAALVSLALGVAALTAAQPAREQANPAALEEALKRLERALVRHGSRAAGGIIRRLDAKDFRGCEITYELTPQVAPGHTGYVPLTERVTIDLSALDPARIEARGGEKGAGVGFASRAGETAVEKRVANEPHTFGDASRLRVYHISLANRAGAEETRAALVRAVELCGR